MRKGNVYLVPLVDAQIPANVTLMGLETAFRRNFLLLYFAPFIHYGHYLLILYKIYEAFSLQNQQESDPNILNFLLGLSYFSHNILFLNLFRIQKTPQLFDKT